MRERWADWENDFLADVYPRREWSIAEIAAKLERSVHSVQIHAATLGIRRPRKLNYDAIRRLDDRGLTPTRIARELGYSRPAVSVALKTIRGAA